MRCVCPRAPPTQWEMLRYNSVMPVAAPRRRRRNRLEWEAYLRWEDERMHYEINYRRASSLWKEKLQDYPRLGVREVWAVGVEAGEIEVLTREERGYRSLGGLSGEQPLTTQVLTGLALTPAEVFGDLNA